MRKNKCVLMLMIGIYFLIGMIFFAGATNYNCNDYVNSSLCNENNCGRFKGDANGDGFINNLDSSVIQSIFMNSSLFFDENLCCVDVNNDSIISNLDALMTQAYFVGNINTTNQWGIGERCISSAPPLNVTCKTDNDCPSDEDKYCNVNGSACVRLIDYRCENHGTINSECIVSNRTENCVACSFNEVCQGGNCIFIGNETNQTNCVDSDGGINIFQMGVTSGLDWANENFVNRTDYCETQGNKTGYLIEYYCYLSNGNYRVKSVSFGPEDGCDLCSDGKCVALNQTNLSNDFLPEIKLNTKISSSNKQQKILCGIKSVVSLGISDYNKCLLIE